jgi:hypothetical protein
MVGGDAFSVHGEGQENDRRNEEGGDGLKVGCAPLGICGNSEGSSFSQVHSATASNRSEPGPAIVMNR